MYRKLCFTILFALFAQHAVASIHGVPGEQPTIQSAILAAQDGDTIVVEEGRYFENVRFYGRDVVLGSRYLLDGVVKHIEKTVIDGSRPDHPDSASCVMFLWGESPSASIVGFTLTGGGGTVMTDQWTQWTFREGGGIIIEGSSPTVRANRIIGNVVRNTEATVDSLYSAGGGGIRAGYGDPTIIGNVIVDNGGRYGSGLVLNVTRAVVRNNIIALNWGGEDYKGGSGVWMWGLGAVNVLENNTIVGNEALSGSGGIMNYNSVIYGQGDIIYGNRGPEAVAYLLGPTAGFALNHSLSDEEMSGEGNLREYPQFADSQYRLQPFSPCVDGANPDGAFNDPPVRDQEGKPMGKAAAPSLKGVHGDMGAWGGPYATELPPVPEVKRVVADTDTSGALHFGPVPVGMEVEQFVLLRNLGNSLASIDSISILGSDEIKIVNDVPFEVPALFTDVPLQIRWKPRTTGKLLAELVLYGPGPAGSTTQSLSLTGR